MAQFARPDADLSVGTWLTDAAAGTDLYTRIDESVASDADYIKSVDAPSSAPCTVRLSDVTDPVSSANHVVRYRYQKSAALGAQVNLTVQLRQGFVSEGTPGTLIAAETVTDIPNGFTDGDFTLSGAEADAISDYTDLAIRFVATQV